ncbi:MAG TPA: divalent-cation tolerance protein CutA [Casimicrobiaceae bacterium]|nr:divalent-cation tolerance protein CutA [Casimicrobiaceae bacterium]
MAAAAILVLTHLPDHDAALGLARTLLAERLAACVNIGAPVDSMYHWRGQIETAREVPVVIKTRAALYPRVEAAIRANHSYELPEIVAVPLAHGSRSYLDWLAAETLET